MDVLLEQSVPSAHHAQAGDKTDSTELRAKRSNPLGAHAFRQHGRIRAGVIGRRTGVRVTTAVLAAGLMLSTPAVAQIFKCASHGHVAYQDTPCPGQASASPKREDDPSRPQQPDMPAPTVVPMPPALEQRAFKSPSSMSLREI